VTIGWVPLQSGLRDALTAWLETWVPPEVADYGSALVFWLLGGVVILLVVQVAMLWATWLERKMVARVQDRLGPNRVGKFGLLQPLADMVKILTKEDITPERAHRAVFNLGAILVVPPAILVFAVIPWSASLIGVDLSVGFLFFVAIASTAVLPIFMAGWGSNNKYALLGAMRAVAQMVAYEIPQVLSVVGILLLAGTLSMQGLVYAQGPVTTAGSGFPGVWFVFLQPIAFVIFLLATTAEIERTPFDIPEAESEIIAGYHTEYSGIKFGMFYLALYFATIAAAALGATLFLGGWQPPLAVLGFIPGWVWFSAKTLVLVVFFMWLRATLPRLRVDQLMAFAWKVLVPLALANLAVAGIVGRLTFDAYVSAAPGSLQASPIFVLAGFTAANVVLLVVFFTLLSSWRGSREKTALTFERAGVEAA
jgi:NADH-quinone oxidoreductase subunit H